MFYRLWTLIIKELQSLLRDPQTRAILIMPVILQVVLFPFAATLDVTNASIAIYSEDTGQSSIELTQRFAKAEAFTNVILLHSPQEIAPTIDNQKALLLIRFPANFSRDILSGHQSGVINQIMSRYYIQFFEIRTELPLKFIAKRCFDQNPLRTYQQQPD